MFKCNSQCTINKILFSNYVPLCDRKEYVHMSVGTSETSDSGAGVIGSYELPEMGAGI